MLMNHPFQTIALNVELQTCHYRYRLGMSAIEPPVPAAPVVSCVVITEHKRILLAKRAIEPRKGTWGIPQGFMEHGETTRRAAAREIEEETGAFVKPSENLIF